MKISLSRTGLVLAIAAVAIGGGVIAQSRLSAEAVAGNRDFTPPASCGSNTMLFPITHSSDVLHWQRKYHETVSDIIEADLHQSDENVSCIDHPQLKATQQLTDLARTLAPWKDGTTPVSESDLTLVLTTYLRTYECTLQQRSFLLPVHVTVDLATQQPLSLTNTPLPLFSVLQATIHEQHVIDDELTVARPTLDRTLQYLAGRSRLRPLQTNLSCLARASADIRNILGLNAEASACLPKIWDARTSLRNP